MDGPVYKVRKEDYMRYVDGTPYMIYTSLALVIVGFSIFSAPSLFVYSLVPLFMAAAIGSPKQERVLVAILGCIMAFVVPMYFKK